MGYKDLEAKKQAMYLAIAQHKAKEALQNLQANGTINNYSMANFYSAGGGLGAYDYSYQVPMSTYVKRAGNKFSDIFESVFNRTIGLRDDYADQMMSILRQQQLNPNGALNNAMQRVYSSLGGK